MPRALVCTAYDDATQTCTAQAWQEIEAGFIDDLPVSDATQIAEAILGLWVIAYVLKSLIRWSKTL